MGAGNPIQANNKTMVIKTRNEFALFLRGRRLTESAVEVGVAEGYFSWHLLDNWPGTLYMVDPWRVLDVAGYSVHGELDQDARYQRVLDKAATYKGRARLMRMTSQEAAHLLNDGHFDFIYIDANHTFPSVVDDIALWWPKVRQGGVLAGHDYLDGVVGGVDYGVKRAVDLFADSLKLKVGVTHEEFPSWWVRKE